MLCCLNIIWYYLNKNNKIENSQLTKSDNDKYIILDTNIYVECNICFEVIALQNMRVLYPCGHRLYCDLCIKNMKNCPLCRSEIKDKVKIYENIDSDSD